MQEKPNNDKQLTLLNILFVEEIDQDIYRGIATPGGVGRSFGGQVLGQALMAATKTAPIHQVVHSLHGYFLRPGDAAKPVLYRVSRDRDGKSFSNRRVSAIQNGDPILSVTCSFHKQEGGFSHTQVPPNVPHPDDLRSEEAIAEEMGGGLPDAFVSRMRQQKPLEMRPVKLRPPMARANRSPDQALWIRARGLLGDDRSLHKAALVYMSDYGLLGTSMLPYGYGYGDPEMQFASLDHSIWIHDDFRADEWLLYSMDSPWAGNARGLSRGLVFTHDGRHVATVAQEGLTRKISH